MFWCKGSLPTFIFSYPISAVDPFISLSIAAGHLTGDSGEPTPSPFLHLLHQAAAAPPWAQSVSALISWNRVIMSDIASIQGQDPLSPCLVYLCPLKRYFKARLQSAKIFPKAPQTRETGQTGVVEVLAEWRLSGQWGDPFLPTIWQPQLDLAFILNLMINITGTQVIQQIKNIYYQLIWTYWLTRSLGTHELPQLTGFLDSVWDTQMSTVSIHNFSSSPTKRYWPPGAQLWYFLPIPPLLSMRRELIRFVHLILMIIC